MLFSPASTSGSEWGADAALQRKKTSRDSSYAGKASRGVRRPRQSASTNSGFGLAAAGAVLARQGSIVTTMSAVGPSAARGSAGGTAAASPDSGSDSYRGDGGSSPAMRDRESLLGPAPSSAQQVASTGSVGSALGGRSRGEIAAVSLLQGGGASSGSRPVLNLERDEEVFKQQPPQCTAASTSSPPWKPCPSRVLDLSAPPSSAAVLLLLGSPASSLGLHTLGTAKPPVPVAEDSSPVSAAAMLAEGTAGGALITAGQHRKQPQHQGFSVGGNVSSDHQSIRNAAFAPAAAAAAPSSLLFGASSGCGAVQLGVVASMRLMQQQQQQQRLMQRDSPDRPFCVDQLMVAPGASWTAGAGPCASGWAEASPEAYPQQLAGGRRQRLDTSLGGSMQLQQLPAGPMHANELYTNRGCGDSPIRGGPIMGLPVMGQVPVFSGSPRSLMPLLQQQQPVQAWQLEQHQSEAQQQQQQQQLGSGDLPFDSEGLLLMSGSNSGGGRVNSWSADAVPHPLQSDEGLPRVLLQSDDAVLPLYTRWMEEGPDGGA